MTATSDPATTDDAADQPEACPGCGAVSEAPAGVAPPPHLLASPGCWSVYGDVVGREHGEWGNPPIHRLTLDAYAAQHPGPETSRRAGAATAGHLIALHLWLERGIEAGRIQRELGRVVLSPSDFHWLAPPPSGGVLTVLDVVGASSLKDHEARVDRWARSVWESWSDHHETVRGWAGR